MIANRLNELVMTYSSQDLLNDTLGNSGTLQTLIQPKHSSNAKNENKFNMHRKSITCAFPETN